MAGTIVKKDMLMAETERHLDQKTTFLNWVNMSYSKGISKQGDTVTVETLPSISLVGGGTAGADIANTDFVITGTNIAADQVDQLKIRITDFEERVSNLNLRSELGAEIARGVLESQEDFFFGLHVNALAANELDGTALGEAAGAVEITDANVYKAFAALKKVLRKQNADVDNAAVFVTPAIEAVLISAGFSNGSDIGYADGKKGMIAKVAGLEIYVNTRVPAGFMIALDRHAIHGVSKYAQVDVRPNPDGFSDNLMVESIYGGQVLPNGSKRIATLAIDNA